MSSTYSKKQNIQFFFVCLFFASLNFEMFSPFVKDFSIAKIAALLYIVVSFFTSKNLFSVKNIERPLLYVFIMFFLMMFSSMIHAHMNRSIFDTTLFLNILMFWIMLNHYRHDNRVFKEGLLWFSMTSFLIGVFYLFNIGVTISQDMRIVVFGENANMLGVKMGVGVLFLLNYCMDHTPEQPIYRPWLLVLTLPMILLLFATASRVALLGLSSGALLFVLFRQTEKKGRRILWLILGGVALYIGYRFILQQDVLVTRMDNSLENRDLTGRDYIWEKYMVLIREYPILGVGFTGAEQYAIQVFGLLRSPHNVLIETMLYSGILGLIWFLAFLTCYFKDAWLWCKKRMVTGPLIISMAVLGMVLSGQVFGVKLFWAVAAYAISYRIPVNHAIR